MAFETMAKTGVVQHFGPRDSSENGKYGGQTSRDDDIVKSAVWDFDYNSLPNHTGAAVSVVGTGMNETIPANARIVSAKLVIDTAFTSTSTLTDLDVGLVNSAGTEIDLNGLITAAEATQTAIAVDNSIITGAGALIGKGIGSSAGYLVVAPNTNDLTAGAGRVIVEYIYNK